VDKYIHSLELHEKTVIKRYTDIRTHIISTYAPEADTSLRLPNLIRLAIKYEAHIVKISIIKRTNRSWLFNLLSIYIPPLSKNITSYKKILFS
jgi:hypothetical protein